MSTALIWLRNWAPVVVDVIEVCWYTGHSTRTRTWARTGSFVLRFVIVTIAGILLVVGPVRVVSRPIIIIVVVVVVVVIAVVIIGIHVAGSRARSL